MISIIVPVFNNSASIATLVSNIQVCFQTIRYPFELILINDGSTDDFKKILASKNCNEVKVIDLDRNYGQVPAILIGISNAMGDGCIVMSADLQEPISLIPDMIVQWKRGFDLVVAKRTKREDGFLNVWISFLFYGLTRIFYKKTPIGGFDFGLIDQSIFKQIRNINPYTVFLQIRLLKLSKNTCFVEYTRMASAQKKSSWSILNKIKYASIAFYEIDSLIYVKLIILCLLAISTTSIAIDIRALTYFFNLLFFFSILLSAYVHYHINQQKKRPLPKLKA